MRLVIDHKALNEITMKDDTPYRQFETCFINRGRHGHLLNWIYKGPVTELTLLKKISRKWHRNADAESSLSGPYAL